MVKDGGCVWDDFLTSRFLRIELVADLPNSSGSGADSVKPVKLFTVIEGEHSQSISSKAVVIEEDKGFGRRKHGRGWDVGDVYVHAKLT